MFISKTDLNETQKMSKSTSTTAVIPPNTLTTADEN